ncbi:MAG TPA: hypothetical protein VIV60_16525, partial [Polyangiaceae bacterium]
MALPAHVTAFLVLFACSNGQRHSADAPNTGSVTAPSVDSAMDGADARNHAKPAADATAPSNADATLTNRTGAEGAASASANPKNGVSVPSDSSGANASSASSASERRNAPEVPAVPKLFDASGKPLPQTEELPKFDSPSFRRRTALLFEAIVKDDPSIATPAFFPVV